MQQGELSRFNGLETIEMVSFLPLDSFDTSLNGGANKISDSTSYAPLSSAKLNC